MKITKTLVVIDAGFVQLLNENCMSPYLQRVT